MSAESKQTVAVVGGHGQIARLLLAELVARGVTPVALVRREEYRAELEALGAQVRRLDLENSTADDFAQSLRGCDAVVFAAGGGPDGNADRKHTVDYEGSVKSIAGAQAVGIRRFVQISAIGVDRPLPSDTSLVWRAYVEAKRDADAVLRGSDLDWTIIRPGRLTDDPATGRVRLGSDAEIEPGGEVTRADVAAVVAAVLSEDRTIGRQLVLVGGTTPIEQALIELG